MKKWIFAGLFIILLGFSFYVLIRELSLMHLLKMQDETYFYLSLFFVIICMGYLFVNNKKTIKSLRSEHHILQLKAIEEIKILEAIFKNTTIGIAIVNLNGNIQKANPVMCRMLGFKEDEINQFYLYQLISTEEIKSFEKNMQHLINKKIKVFQTEQELYKKNKDSIWSLLTLNIIYDDQEQPKHFVLQLQNITQQKRAEARLKHMAYHDALTGLANRNKLEQFINHIISSARRYQQGFALVFLDLDKFKNINDTIGHEAGDMVLQIISERLYNVMRQTDIVARLGGDEFVILLTNVKTAEGISVILEKIMTAISEVMVIKGQEIFLTASLGISLYPLDGQNIETLMKNADIALYRSKEQGRNTYQFYTLEMTSKAQEKLALQNALSHALVRDEFYLNYQPIMDIKTRKIVSIEALLRWDNHEFGYITPNEIIHIIEESGLINKVGEQTLLKGCEDLKKWHDMGFSNLTLSVNCAARQFKQANFSDQILTILNKVGLKPESLVLEVTESTIMQDPENTLRALYALKDLGVQIAIDDFGTGYWSLSNLRRLYVDQIKIDKTFIKQIGHDEISLAITKAIIAMVKKLGLKTIAEGVETKEQYQILTNEGCGQIQGYYLKRPLNKDAITEFLQHPIPDGEVIARSTNKIENEE